MIENDAAGGSEYATIETMNEKEASCAKYINSDDKMEVETVFSDKDLDASVLTITNDIDYRMSCDTFDSRSEASIDYDRYSNVYSEIWNG